MEAVNVSEIDTVLTHLGWIVESELWSAQRINQWADSVIGDCDSPPPWILDLSVCSTLRECRVVVAQQLEHRFWFDGARPGLGGMENERAEVLVGMALLRLRRGQFTRSAFIQEVLGILDAYQPQFLAVDDSRVVDAEGDVLAIPSLEGLLSRLEEVAVSIENAVAVTRPAPLNA